MSTGQDTGIWFPSTKGEMFIHARLRRIPRTYCGQEWNPCLSKEDQGNSGNA